MTGVSAGILNVQGLGQRRLWLASVAAILVHAIGLTGILYIDRDWFLSMTPINLLVMIVLIIWTRTGQPVRGFFTFFAVAYFCGMILEIIGVNSGLVFGRYHYTQVLGPQIAGVPLLIGLNWFFIVLASASFHKWVSNLLWRMFPSMNKGWIAEDGGVLAALGTACITVLFDAILEPAAVSLGYWVWGGDGSVPMYNYVCWFVIGFFLHMLMRNCGVKIPHYFAMRLLLIQGIFFCIVILYMR